MEEELKLSVLEQNNLKKGLASSRVRLKAGRIIWDELEKRLGAGTGDEKKDADHLFTFKLEVDARPFYEQFALIEWLRAQIDNYPELLGRGRKELNRQMAIYAEHLKVLRPSEFKSQTGAGTAADSETEDDEGPDNVSAIDGIHLFD